jgi:FlaA1/EpsC-like NDP-sugar epimerase
MQSFIRQNKKFFLVLLDVFVIFCSYGLGAFFRYDLNTIINIKFVIYQTLLFVVPLYILSFCVGGIYKKIWAHSSLADYLKIAILVGAITIFYILLTNLFNIQIVSMKMILLSALFSIIAIVGIRVAIRGLSVLSCQAYSTIKNKDVLIIGAGSTAKMLINDIKVNSNLNYKIIGLIDDNKDKYNGVILGHKVLGTTGDIIRICSEYDVELILLAIPSASDEEKQRILTICSETACEIKVLPSVDQILKDGGEILKKKKKIQIEDLLEREPVKLDNKGLLEEIANKTILVSGGGGSIGSELCRQIVKYQPKKLIILDNYENTTYELQNELLRAYPDLNLDVIIASVRDKDRLNSIFKNYKPTMVFHAAAHKHVPLMEFNPSEAVKNNVFGTYNMAKCADEFGVKKFVMISTDKAVNPTNVMGATKRICEMIVQSMQEVSKTEFVAVRFGNVLGSNGSVIPLFKKQIAEGGPVTLTHKDITRYFMTIPEAAQLVLQSANYAKGGEIFVLDMGKPVKIYDLAEKLIKLSGYTPNVDMEIRTTGLRPGEKLYEELLMDEEGLTNTSHSKIFIGKPIFCDIVSLTKQLEHLKEVTETLDKIKIKEAVAEITGTYSIDTVNCS